jgi:hypothetical protein
MWFRAKDKKILGMEGKKLLENKAFLEALNDIEIQYFDAWRTSLPMEKVRREKLYMAMQLTKKVRNNIIGYVDDHKIESFNGNKSST